MTVPLDPNGGPVLGSTSTPTTQGAYTLWDIPHELIDYLNATSNGKLWFDIGQRKTQSAPALAGTVSTPGLVGATGGQDYVPGSANAAEHDTKKVTKNETYDIYSKPWQVMAQFQAMSMNDPVRFAELQQALAAGPWGAVHINGVFDINTEKALAGAMTQYVKLSMGTGAAPVYTDPKTGKKSGGFVAYLMNSAATAQSLGGGGTSLGGGSKNPISVTDPNSIRQAAIQAAQAALGENISSDQIDKFVQQFQAAQTAAQTQVGGTASAPDLSSDAMSYVQKSDPQAYHDSQRQAFVNSLVNMFAPSASQRPNMTPVPSVGG